jgi:hypothetical protein
MGIPLTRIYFCDIPQTNAGQITPELVRPHGFQRIDSAIGQRAVSHGDDSPIMMVSFAQADSALVSAYYAGKRERSEAPAGIGDTPRLDLSFYYVPDEGIYGPVIDGHYMDEATRKLVAIAAEPIPGQKRRGRPPKQGPVQAGDAGSFG